MREEILGKKVSLPHAEVDIPEWGGKFIVSALTAADIRPITELVNRVDGVGAVCLTVALSLQDETGSMIFKQSDAKELEKQNFALLRRISDIASQLGGETTQEEIERGKPD